jgi:hypothetical protein
LAVFRALVRACSPSVLPFVQDSEGEPVLAGCCSRFGQAADEVGADQTVLVFAEEILQF